MSKNIDPALLKQIRLGKAYSQADLAKKAKLTTRTVQRAELEGTCSLRTLRALAQALDLQPNELEISDQESSISSNSGIGPLPWLLKLGAILLIIWGAILVGLTVLEIILEPFLERFLEQEVEAGIGVTPFIGVFCIVSGLKLFSRSSLWKNVAICCYGVISIHTTIAAIRLVSSYFNLGPVYASGYSDMQISSMQTGISIFTLITILLSLCFVYQIYLLSNASSGSVFNQ